MLKENFIETYHRAFIENWDRPCMLDYRSGSKNYHEIASEIQYIHKIFEDNQISKGDKIALIGKSNINWGITYLSVITYGAVIVPILSDFIADDIHHIIEHSDARIFFCSSAIYKNLNDNKMPTLKGIVCLDDMRVLLARDLVFPEVYKPEAIQPDELKFATAANNELATIQYTSGTSGFSKGVMLTYNSLIANVKFARENIQLTAGDPIVSFLPLAHAYGCAFEFLFPLSLGCNITFFGKAPTPQLILQAFQEVRPTLILSVPLIIEKIFKKQIAPVIQKPTMKVLLSIPGINTIIHKKIRDKLLTSFGGRIMEFVIGGAPLSHEVERFLKKIRFPYSVGYGMTECGPLISYDGWKTSAMYSAGKLVDMLTIKVINKNNEGFGEFCVRGENVMLGYYKNDAATKKAIDEDGWLHTGDLGFIDKNGYIFIKGRSKSMILGPNGQNIFPEEIEARINNIPCVMESLVLSRDGKIHAIVYPDMECFNAQEDINARIEEQKNELNSKLPKYMQIARMEVRKEEFEKTPKKSIKRYKYE